MAIVGVGFNKIMVERKKTPKGKVGIRNNIAIKKVEKADLSFGAANQKGLRFSFEYTSIYTPDIGEILLTGDVIDIMDVKKADEIEKEWNKSKKIPSDLMNSLLNAILNKCNIEALLLAREISLPAPIPLPKVNLKQK